MEIPFVPGIIMAIIFYIIVAKYWCKFADWVGEALGLKKLIKWLLKDHS